jgi:hypothetical protein
MLGILPAKGLEFPDVVLMNFFCRNKTAHNSDAAVKRMMALQGYRGPMTLEEAKANPNPSSRKRFESARRDAKRALDAQAAEGQKNERARQRAWKWLLSQHRSEPPPIPREVEVDLKLLYTAISRCSNRLYFVETAESEAGTEWKKWLLANVLAKCAIAEDYEVEGSESDRERWGHHKSRGLELAAEAADSAEDGESADLFEQAAASFKAAGELKLEERVRIQAQAQSYRTSIAEWTVDQLVQHTTQLMQHQLLHEAALLCKSWAEEKSVPPQEPALPPGFDEGKLDDELETILDEGRPSSRMKLKQSHAPTRVPTEVGVSSPGGDGDLPAEGLDVLLAKALSIRLRFVCGIHDGRAESTPDKGAHLAQPASPIIDSAAPVASATHGTDSAAAGRGVNTSSAYSGGSGGANTAFGKSKETIAGGNGGGEGALEGGGSERGSDDAEEWAEPETLEDNSGADSGADSENVHDAHEDHDMHEQFPTAAPTLRSQSCCQCGAESTELQQCARCRSVIYCSQQCQTAHWRARHRHECAPFVD